MKQTKKFGSRDSFMVCFASACEKISGNAQLRNDPGSPQVLCANGQMVVTKNCSRPGWLVMVSQAD